MSPRIGPYTLKSPVVLAPMAGVTDQPFRLLCMRLGAGMVVAEMLTSDSRLWHSRKSQLRLIHQSEPEPRPALCGTGRPDRRYQHGLSGQKSLQEGRRLGAA